MYEVRYDVTTCDVEYLGRNDIDVVAIICDGEQVGHEHADVGFFTGEPVVAHLTPLCYLGCLELSRTFKKIAEEIKRRHDERVKESKQ